MNNRYAQFLQRHVPLKFSFKYRISDTIWKDCHVTIDSKKIFDRINLRTLLVIDATSIQLCDSNVQQTRHYDALLRAAYFYLRFICPESLINIKYYSVSKFYELFHKTFDDNFDYNDPQCDEYILKPLDHLRYCDMSKTYRRLIDPQIPWPTTYLANAVTEEPELLG